MSIRFYCDLCGREDAKGGQQPKFETIFAPKPGRFGKIEKVGIQIYRRLNDVWNGGVICNLCLAKSLEQVVTQLRAEAKEEDNEQIVDTARSVSQTTQKLREGMA